MDKQLKIFSRCVSCDNCHLICPEGAIIKNGQKYTVETWACTICYLCVEICPTNCIKLVEIEKEVDL
ncbi:MAG: 4Fe-4S binding protein [Bdellovibrionales bacterium]|jgi:Pyruvate/2-oxoacid:ferredoxin oxidoreductase delta subunit|nr:4Fe-4S binding protein [Bdellovibrionales bacterium]MBT3525320.1 4Fe-4S binding protein [Bdellovibrionales bacterium]MBT7669827.1 4Fe-4S binding protein [Bdellovibrionales bacterium]MBT7766139.1 4Fe-4S binding protein [Bdellovibrionales bacterium]